LQTAFSGFNARAGPPVDLYLQLLDCKPAPNNRFFSKLLQGVISSHFYHYQITNAISYILKLYRKIDAEKLLQDTGNTKNPRADIISVAAKQLNNLLLYGAILTDNIGLEKTKQALLVEYLHTLLYNTKAKDNPSKLQHQPILLVVPSTLINQ